MATKLATLNLTTFVIVVATLAFLGLVMGIVFLPLYSHGPM